VTEYGFPFVVAVSVATGGSPIGTFLLIPLGKYGDVVVYGASILLLLNGVVGCCGSCPIGGGGYGCKEGKVR
jgi:hypothetical protein